MTRANAGAALALLLPLLPSAHAVVTFSWYFADSNNPVTQCGQSTFTVNAGEARATLVPPYYLWAVPTGGVPTVTKLSDGNTGSWTVPYAATTQLQLEIVDSAGNEGGWVSASVGSGSSTSCIQARTSTVQLAVNSSTVSTCGTLGIQMGGTGRPPFNLIFLPAAGSQFATQNLTLSSSDNYLSWVSNITSGNSVLIAGRDAQGNFAPTSSLVSITDGGSAGSCGRQSTSSNGPPSGQSGLVSTTVGSASGSATSTAAAVVGSPNVASSGNGSGSSNNVASGSSGGGSSSNVGAIAGGAAGGVIALLALAGLLWWCLRRRRRPTTAKHGATTTYLRPTLDGDDDPEAIDGVRPMSQAAHLTPFDLSSVSHHSSDVASSSQRTPLFPPGASHSVSSGYASAGHPAAAGTFSVANPDPVAGPSRGGGMTSAKQSEASALLGRSDSLDGAGGPVIQHQDGGAVRPPADIPPAYGQFVDRQRSLREARP